MLWAHTRLGWIMAFTREKRSLCHLAYDLTGLQMELTDRRGLHVTQCDTSLGLPKANGQEGTSDPTSRGTPMKFWRECWRHASTGTGH